MKIRYLFFISAVLLSVFLSFSKVSAIHVKPLSPGNDKNLYQVTCDNGKQHTIIADHVDQNFQYYYPDKGYYIKYYDMAFKRNYDFAEWVCRNK